MIEEVSDRIEQAAEILYQHTYVIGAYECSCQSNEDYPNTMDIDEWKTHAALALADAGLLTNCTHPDDDEVTSDK